MDAIFPKPKVIFTVILFILALSASRFINLDKTARFIWDESSDLVNMHQIYVEKKLTLVGPISEDGSKVFGSLTYYMLLPFAAAGKFDPVAPAYGAAFWGVVTGVLILYLASKINRSLMFPVGLLILIWYPLVETGRWAWNPNLIPLWVTLSLIFFLQKTHFSLLLSGLAMGLSLHHHYLSLFAAIGLGLMVIKDCVQEKRFVNLLSYSAGFLLAVAPFVIFDLMHPPGLFSSRILYFNSLSGSSSFLPNLFSVISGALTYITQFRILIYLFALTVLALIINDVKSRSKALSFFGVVLVQVIGLGFVQSFNTHYILPVLPFLVVYLLYPRKNFGKVFSLIGLTILIISGVFSFPNQIARVTWENNIKATRYISVEMEKAIKDDDLKNNNVAVLGSPDPNTYGRRYRDLLLIDGVTLKTKGEYEISDHLFLVTTSSLESVRNDPSYEMKYFQTGPLIKEWSVPGSDWKMYLLTRSI